MKYYGAHHISLLLFIRVLQVVQFEPPPHKKYSF